MTPNPLVPTPRTDKNGRTVIRHMKPQQTGSMESKKLPAAVPVANTQPAALNKPVGIRRLWSNLVRRTMTSEALYFMSPQRREHATALMPLLTDKALKEMRDELKPKNRSQNLIFLDTQVFVERYEERGPRELKIVAELMIAALKEAEEKGALSETARENAPDTALKIAKAFVDESSPAHLTVQEKRAIVTVAVLAQTSDEKGRHIGYKPAFPSFMGQNTIDHYVTSAIFLAPDRDPEEYAALYLERLQRKNELSKLLHDNLDGIDNICDYPDSLITVLAEVRKQQDDYFWRSLRESISTNKIRPDVINETLSYRQIPFANYGFDNAFRIIEGLDSYPELAWTNPADQDIQRKRREAFLRVNLALRYECSDEIMKHFDAQSHLSDHRLVDLLLKTPELGQAVVDVIVDRRTFDYDQFIESQNSGALGDGTL